MTELWLHFDPQPGMDAAAVAQQLRERCANFVEVEDARLEGDGKRLVVVDDIVIVLTVSAKVFGAGALALEALRRMIVAAKGAAKELGVTNVTVEGDGALVAPENLTEAHAQFIARPAR